MQLKNGFLILVFASVITVSFLKWQSPAQQRAPIVIEFAGRELKSESPKSYLLRVPAGQNAAVSDAGFQISTRPVPDSQK